MQGSLSWQLDQENGKTRVALGGDITEDSDFASLLSQLATASVVIDLGDVRRINSCGVREWINFVNALDHRATTFELERCSVPIVNQLNMISNFRGKGTVRSVYAPYFCTSCDQERTRLIDLASSGEVHLDESMPCPTCGSDMEFDDLPERFLSFAGI